MGSEPGQVAYVRRGWGVLSGSSDGHGGSLRGTSPPAQWFLPVCKPLLRQTQKTHSVLAASRVHQPSLDGSADASLAHAD